MERTNALNCIMYRWFLVVWSRGSEEFKIMSRSRQVYIAAMAVSDGLKRSTRTSVDMASFLKRVNIHFISVLLRRLSSDDTRRTPGVLSC